MKIINVNTEKSDRVLILFKDGYHTYKGTVMLDDAGLDRLRRLAITCKVPLCENSELELWLIRKRILSSSRLRWRRIERVVWSLQGCEVNLDREILHMLKVQES